MSFTCVLEACRRVSTDARTHGRVDACFVLEVTSAHPGIFNDGSQTIKYPPSSSSLEKENGLIENSSTSHRVKSTLAPPSVLLLSSRVFTSLHSVRRTSQQSSSDDAATQRRRTHSFFFAFAFVFVCVALTTPSPSRRRRRRSSCDGRGGVSPTQGFEEDSFWWESAAGFVKDG
jgi:hypothetical protein